MRLFSIFTGGFALAILAALTFNIWMLVDAIRRQDAEFNPPGSRVWWIVGLAVGIFLNWLGLAVSIVYFFAVRKPLMQGRPPSPLFGGGTGPSGSLPTGSGRMCLNCGHVLGTHTRFCQNCGTPIGED